MDEVQARLCDGFRRTDCQNHPEWFVELVNPLGAVERRMKLCRPCEARARLVEAREEDELTVNAVLLPLED
ncbi:hypothetical protein [Streptomyces sp. enrichment culture]|uniref:hypothetical protein n=1 Tax=Streptomyces sp. enrichment culture TaxID=1795815 RepID=UPI003F5605DE